MTTAARAQWLHTAPPPPHELESKLLPSNAHTNIPKQHTSTAMTWQQMEDFPQYSKPRQNYRNRPQKKQWHNDNNTNKEGHVAVKDGDKNAPAQAATSYPTPPTNTHLSQDKPTCNTKQEPKEANTRLSHDEFIPPRVSDEYIPPHMRKHLIPPHLRDRTSVKGAGTNTGNGTGAANLSPASSATTKSTAFTKPEFIPARTALRHVTPPSPATTPCEPAEHEKSNAAIPRTFQNAWDHQPAIKQPADSWDSWGQPVFKQQTNIWDQPSVKQPVDSWDSWGQPLIKQPTDFKEQSPVKKPRNPRGPRRSQPHKKHVWPKNKDMKYIPTSDDGGVKWESDSNGDPDYDVKKLLDWNGDWLPPPESWCARRSWDDRHFGEHIAQWLNRLAPECVGALYYPLKTFNPEQGPCKQLAPRYWLQARVEGTSLRESWKIICASQPKPLDDDIIDSPPWWELYEDVVYTEIIQKEGQESQIHHASSYLNALPEPEAKLDLTDPENLGPPGHMISAADRMLELHQKREEKRRRMLVRIHRPIPKPTMPVITAEDRSLHPRLNIYIRPVQAADVAGIMEIYNWYVERTIHVPEFDPRTEAQIRQRINTITNAGLPYLVAILKKTPSKPTPGYVSEKLVGWISLDEYCSQLSIYRYTFDMQLFVHPGHRSKGTAKCLVDKLLDMADTGYRVRGGYQYVNDYEYLKSGPRRVIKTILLNVHHENGEDADNEWQAKFLNFCKFHRVGRLPKVGYKNGKVIDVSIYAHHTKEDIDPEVRPAVTG